MLNRTRRLTVLSGVVALALTAGCTSPDPKTETTSPTPQVSTPSAEEQSAEEQQAVADATAALYRFHEVRNQCLDDPQNADVSCFDSVAVDEVLANYQTTLANLQRDRLHYEGTSEVLSVELVWVNLDGSPKQIRLATCVDQRSRRLVDESGAQLGSAPTATQRVVWQLINYSYPEPDQWKVSYHPEEESESC